MNLTTNVSRRAKTLALGAVLAVGLLGTAATTAEARKRGHGVSRRAVVTNYGSTVRRTHRRGSWHANNGNAWGKKKTAYRVRGYRTYSRARDADQDGIPNWKDRDIDNDGIRNARDRDRDNDGRRNGKDNYPRNPRRR